MKRCVGILVIMLLVASMLYCAENEQAQQEKQSEYKVIKIFDGDTIVLDIDGVEERVRFIGMDTPEVAFGKKPAEYFANEATKHLEEILSKHKITKLEYDVTRRDKYDRLLAYLFLDNGEMLNVKMVKDGYAYTYTFPPNVKYEKRFQNAMRYARENSLGLWKDGTKVFSATDIDSLEKYIGKYVTVQGVIKKTYKSKKALYFNFGDDYRTDFTIVVFKNCWHNFRLDSEDYYLHKKVRVSGKLKRYNGPEIIINKPEEIEVVE